MFATFGVGEWAKVGRGLPHAYCKGSRMDGGNLEASPGESEGEWRPDCPFAGDCWPVPRMFPVQDRLHERTWKLVPVWSIPVLICY